LLINYFEHHVDGVVEYSMRQGVRHDGRRTMKDNHLDLSDATYDGQIVDGQLSGGLGQLMDGEEGQSNFRLDLKNFGVKG